MAAVAHLPVAASSGSFLITPNVGLMIWTLLLFGISMYILWKLAFPRISEALDRRQHAIEESIDHAESVRKQADDLLKEYQQRLAEARQQAEQIVERSRKTAEAREREVQTEAQERREQLMEQTRRDIESETRRAIQEIRREVADLTVLATEKITRKVLDADDQRRLVEEALSELDFSALAPDGGDRN
ncbi:MAG TPA: F0F1 ATP synthase subunit B [Solirubrobacteraceae bacterium]|nr:F0F1 ATP synthase subunit B [Solirubrobacteraceae bacterium]